MRCEDHVPPVPVEVQPTAPVKSEDAGLGKGHLRRRSWKSVSGAILPVSAGEEKVVLAPLHVDDQHVTGRKVTPKLSPPKESAEDEAMAMEEEEEPQTPAAPRPSLEEEEQDLSRLEEENVEVSFICLALARQHADLVTGLIEHDFAKTAFTHLSVRTAGLSLRRQPGHRRTTEHHPSNKAQLHHARHPGASLFHLFHLSAARAEGFRRSRYSRPSYPYSSSCVSTILIQLGDSAQTQLEELYCLYHDLSVLPTRWREERFLEQRKSG